MPKVFVVQETNHSVIKAQRFGQPQILLSRGWKSLDMAEQIRAGLKDITPQDWLLPVGDPASIAVAAAEMGRLTGHLRLLRWDRATDDYETLEVTL